MLVSRPRGVVFCGIANEATGFNREEDVYLVSAKIESEKKDNKLNPQIFEPCW